MAALPESVEKELFQLRKDLLYKKDFPQFFFDESKVHTCGVYPVPGGGGYNFILNMRVIFKDRHGGEGWADYSGPFKVVWNQEGGYDYMFEPTHRVGQIPAYARYLSNGRNWRSAPFIKEVYEDIRAYLASIEEDYYVFKKKHYS